jgi:hypothetical protein
MAAPRTVCRYGRACHRQGCYFAHPEGRDIDGQPSPYGEDPSVAPVTASFSLLKSNLGPTSAPAARPVLPPSKVPCKFDRKCTRQVRAAPLRDVPVEPSIDADGPACARGRRQNCHFNHPNGREMEDGYTLDGEEDSEDEIDEIQRALEEEDQKKMEL